MPNYQTVDEYLADTAPTKKVSQQVRQALANLILEGLRPSKRMLLDLVLLDEGKITRTEYIRRSFGEAGLKAH